MMKWQELVTDPHWINATIRRDGKEVVVEADCIKSEIQSLQSRLAEKEAECAVMRASLKKYGRHDPECEKACPTDCDCGYNKIISSASASRIEAVERAGKILEEPNKNHWAIAQPQLLEVLENALTELRKLLKGE